MTAIPRPLQAFLLALLISGTVLRPALSGDSSYGKVTEVKGGDLVTFDYGAGQYNVRIIGIEAPKDGEMARAATEFLSRMVQDKNARIRFEYRAPNGEMVSKLLTDDPVLGIRDVGVELLRVGLARRQKDFDYKYGELSRAEIEAQQNRRGLWSAAQPR